MVYKPTYIKKKTIFPRKMVISPRSPGDSDFVALPGTCGDHPETGRMAPWRTRDSGKLLEVE